MYMYVCMYVILLILLKMSCGGRRGIPLRPFGVKIARSCGKSTIFRLFGLKITPFGEW